MARREQTSNILLNCSVAARDGAQGDRERSLEGAPTLGALLAQFATAGLAQDDMVDRPWSERPLGGEFE